MTDSRFTSTALGAIRSAQENAARLGHSYVGSEHLLLGLASLEYSPAAQALRRAGADRKTLRAGVVRRVGVGVPARCPRQGLTPHCCQAIRGAAEESRRLGQRAVSAEHLLLGLLGETDSGAFRVLDSCGVDIPALYRRVTAALGGEETAPRFRPREPETRPGGDTRQLDQCSRDLTAMAAQGQLDPVIGREAELERMHGNLLRAVSHDIRTPLTGIVGATNVLLEQENTLTPEQRHELIRNANEEAQWLIRIVENLLSITRMGGDEAKVNKTPEAAEEIIEGAVGKFTRRWGTDIPVEVRLPEEFLLVPMDPLLMEQVLTNLMENAVLHGKTTRHITVTLCRSGDWARFIVEDDGQGIAPDRLEHLFDGTLQGQQGDRGRSMGIGLSVCRTVVRAHGGHIRGENRTEAHGSPWSCLWIKKFSRR